MLNKNQTQSHQEFTGTTYVVYLALSLFNVPAVEIASSFTCEIQRQEKKIASFEESFSK